MLSKMIFTIEEVLSELVRDDINEQGLAPGFRFHPTDEELITFYLASKVYNGGFCGVNIAEVDLNRCEPWELPDMAKMGEREWYLFSLRDRKYPTGLRTNRATGAGYWKASGKDRQVYCASSGALLGMKKTLVFYKGKAPRGEKTMWVMHEYRLDGHFSTPHTCKEEEWVMCRIYHKTGEKKKPLFQGRQNYLLESAASSPTTNWLPQLLETQFQNPFVISQYQQHQQENDIKSLINPALSQSQHLPMNALFQSSSFSPTRTKNTNNTTSTSSLSSSMLFKSLLSNQDYCINSIKEENTIPKVERKTEVNFSHFQIPSSDSSFQSMEKNQSNNTFQYQYQNQLLLPLDKMMMDYSGVFGDSATVCSAYSDVTTVNDRSTSIAFNGFGFQMMLDPPSKLPRLSWPLDA